MEGRIAGELVRKGHAPPLVTGNPEIARAIREKGISVRTPEGRFTVP